MRGRALNFPQKNLISTSLFSLLQLKWHGLMPEQIVILIIFTQLEDMCSKPIKMSYTFSGKVTASGLRIDNITFLICSFRS